MSSWSPWSSWSRSEKPPQWAVHLTQLSQQILARITNNEGSQMAAMDDVTAAVGSLKDAITLALNALATKADAGALSGADVRTVISTLNAEHDAVLAAVSAAQTPAAVTQVQSGPIDPSTQPAAADAATADPNQANPAGGPPVSTDSSTASGSTTDATAAPGATA